MVRRPTSHGLGNKVSRTWPPHPETIEHTPVNLPYQTTKVRLPCGASHNKSIFVEWEWEVLNLGGKTSRNFSLFTRQLFFVVKQLFQFVVGHVVKGLVCWCKDCVGVCSCVKESVMCLAVHCDQLGVAKIVVVANSQMGRASKSKLFACRKLDGHAGLLSWSRLPLHSSPKGSQPKIPVCEPECCHSQCFTPTVHSFLAQKCSRVVVGRNFFLGMLTNSCDRQLGNFFWGDDHALCPYHSKRQWVCSNGVDRFQ